MTPARPLTLLQLAIAASAAVVPILLGVLLVVAWPRGDDDAGLARGDERHVSVRHVAALKTFEHAIVRSDRVAVAPPSADALLAGIPTCRAEWSAARGVVPRLRAALSRTAADDAPGPAARIAAQLADIDRALRRFSGVANRRVTDPVGLDGARWIEAVTSALATPAESPDLPGRRFAVRCEDIALAVRTLARSDARMLASLAWRGTVTERSLARWRADQYVEISPRQVARANPWAGLPGCIYLGGAGDASTRYFVAGARGLDESLCARAEMRRAGDPHADMARLAGEPSPDLPADDPRWKVPPSLAAMLQPLEALHRPGSATYRAFTRPAPARAGVVTTRVPGPNRIAVGGSPVEVGFSLDLTIDPEVQALAQRTAACYTGRDDVCRAMGMHRHDDVAGPLGGALLEHAMVRMAAVAIIDVASGRIEALAGAMSPCTREEHDGPGRSSRCDRRLPYPIRYRPDALLNPAVFHDAMPASTIKPIMAAAFLSDPGIGARWLAAELAGLARARDAVPSMQSLRGELVRSDSARFLDRMFCSEQDFRGCARPWAIQAEAVAFGWNAGCSAADEDCGKRDVLFGASGEARVDGGASAFALEVPFGRLLAEPAGPSTAAAFRLRPETALDLARVRRCSAGPDGRRMSPDDWEKCSGGVVVDVVAEGWGQGHARASALGGAGMMATIAAAANGQPAVRRPHLVDAVRGARASGEAASDATILGASAIAPASHGISRAAAEVIVSGLSYGHRAGTSRRACEQVYSPEACARIDWIAGKTGTPTFPNDDRSLDELARLCKPGVATTKAERAACGPLRPYKWYVAAYRTDPADPRWTKAIGVLTERNWLADGGRIHGAGDRGPNPAAEIAFQIAGRHAAMLPGSAP
jgi:hypothetical protein